MAVTPPFAVASDLVRCVGARSEVVKFAVNRPA